MYWIYEVSQTNKMSRERIFVAVTISKKVREEIVNWERKFGNLPVRWLSEKNLHVTIIPPWYAANSKDVADALQGVTKTGPINLLFEKVMYGPNSKKPRLIWAEGRTPEELEILKKRLEGVLGTKGEDRQLRLHLTLARFRPETFSSFAVKKLEERVRWPVSVKSFLLMRSQLSRAGADYEVIEEFLL